MRPSGLEERFEEAMRVLTDLYSEAIRLRRSATDAEREFANGLRVGDLVRRAVRQGRVDRPDDSDCAALEGVARRLRVALDEAKGSREAGELTRALERGDLAVAAQYACLVYTGLEPVAAAGRFAYRPVALRSRQQSAGETLAPPEDLARRIAAHVGAGLAPHDLRALEDTTTTSLPPPIVLAPSLDGCGSEVAIRVTLGSLDAAPLRHTHTGDLWVFAPRIRGPFTVAAATEADDEWWAASPVPYRVYLLRLDAALGARGLRLFVEPEPGP